MTPYQARFITHANRVFDTQDFEAESDDHAIRHAWERFRSGIGKGYEIWSGDRHVHTQINPGLSPSAGRS